MPKKYKMSNQMKAFADIYLEHMNATKAYMEAYKCKNEVTARTNGYKNLQKPMIRDYIENRLEEIKSKRVASVQEVMEFYTRVLRGEEKDSFGLEVGVDSKIKAAENLSKRLGLIRTEEEEVLRLKQLELEIKKKELEIEKLKIGESSESTKTMEAIKKLGEKIAGDFS